MNTADRSQTVDAERSDTAADASSPLPFVLAAAVLIAMLYGGYKWYQVRQFEVARANDLPASRLRMPLTNFELTERSGETFRSADMRGKVWVASYFFSSCMGTCQRLNENIARMNARPELADVNWVSITCDPDNDTLPALRDYANKFHADAERWLFCRGDFETTKEIARGMNLALAMKMHADHAVVIDRSGTIRGYFDATSTQQCDRMRVLLGECLAERPTTDPSAAGSSDPGA
jgi:cytochrome oxidase Cu insertion factor (SCO1/SenC/PrrC family)